MRRAFAFIVLGRDKGTTGSITIDRVDGNPRIHYPLENHDRNSLMDGLIAAARIACACGATQIGSSFSSMGLRNLPEVRENGTKEEILLDEKNREAVSVLLVFIVFCLQYDD
jgi:hypothetical protein